MAPDASGKGLLLKADPIADAFRDEVKASLAQCLRTPTLVGILGTSAAPSRFYAEFTRKQCEELGVRFVLKMVGSAESAGRADGEGVEEAIIEANEDVNIDGIMVYYPIYGGQQDHYLQQIVSPLKDVEGLHSKFHYNLYHNIRFIDPNSLTSSIPSSTPHIPVKDDIPPPGTVKSILPCTPLGVVKSLEYIGVYNKILTYGDRAYGKTVTVINRSEVVGRPLAALLANDGARVFSVDIDSIQEYTKRPRTVPEATRKYLPHHVAHPSNLSLGECLEISDVVISAVPSAEYKVKTEWLKEGCIAVNIAADKNFEKDVRDKASIYIPAVGKVTILMLLRNLCVFPRHCHRRTTPGN
ncbi:NAD(P)-binding protein [Gyrodon lividus]|nr:NAD(P)-binding protein [Gyrodon lividus]